MIKSGKTISESRILNCRGRRSRNVISRGRSPLRPANNGTMRILRDAEDSVPYISIVKYIASNHIFYQN